MNDDPKTLLPDFIARFRPAFPAGYNDRAQVFSFLETSFLAPGFVPKMAAVDRQGWIRAQYDGDQPIFRDEDQMKNMRLLIEEMLKLPPVHTVTPATRKKSTKK